MGSWRKDFAKMAQGKMKTKTKLPSGAKQKAKHQKKQLGPKKGGRTIAPKKAAHVQAAKLKKDLTRAINTKNENEMTARASTSEVKSFSVLKSTTPATGETSKSS